ncbi:MAG TPA: RNA-binding protein [Aestuariivirgaceae bacterium]|nr:RNA-binding protein [Aestuariivirgaceae bacterium]
MTATEPLMTERMCIVTRQPADAGELLRFVLGPDRLVVPDLRHKLPGRGVWVSANAESLDKALKANLFPKAFRSKCRADPDLVALVRRLLRDDARQVLALANKAGLVTVGFEKTLSELARGSPRLLLEAADGAEDGRRKLRARRPDGCDVIDVFKSAELDLALGRTNVVHAAVAGGGLAGRLLSATRRIEGFEAPLGNGARG